MSVYPIQVILGRNVTEEPPVYSAAVCQNKAGYIWVFARTSNKGWRVAGSDFLYSWGEILNAFTVLHVTTGRTVGE